jgi:CDP-4-dehydro-6-deoxyglucose reductase
MPELLTVSRAARLAGVTRGAIQGRIQSGELPTFEGKVRVTDLLRVFPSVVMDASPMLERVEAIKANASPKPREGEGVLPSAEVLVKRLQTLAQVLIEAKSGLNRSVELLNRVAARLDALAAEPGPAPAREVAALAAWLREQMVVPQPQADGQAKLFAKDTFLRVMAANVKVIPSGHEFFVEGADSILEAAVRAGLGVNYGCTSGNCGSCKARVVSGQVWKIRDHDYVLSEREKRLGYLLMCSNSAVTDLVLEAAEASQASDLPVQQIRATAQRLERVADDLLILNVQTTRAQTLRFMAGQSATLTVADEVSASLPIASCPCDGRNLEFHVRRVPGDRFSEVVFEALRAPEMVTLTGPVGEFVLHDDSTRPLVFVAIDDGFAPLKSLIQHAISIDNAESFHLYWLASCHGGHYLDNLCRSWRDALENFRYTPIALPEGAAPEQVAELLAPLAGEPRVLGLSEFYVAGPEAAVDATTTFLRGHGVPLDRVRAEVVPGRGISTSPGRAAREAEPGLSPVAGGRIHGPVQ